MSITQMGWYSGVSFGGMAAVAALAGYAADRLIAKGRDPINVRKGFTIAGFVMAATQTISVFTDSVPAMIFFTVFSLCGLGLATANYWALTQTLIPGGSIALVVGIQNTAANLAGIVAPWLTGWMIQKDRQFDTDQGCGRMARARHRELRVLVRWRLLRSRPAKALTGRTSFPGPCSARACPGRCGAQVPAPWASRSYRRGPRATGR